MVKPNRIAHLSTCLTLFGLIGFLLLQDPTLGIPVQGRTLFTLK